MQNYFLISNEHNFSDMVYNFNCFFLNLCFVSQVSLSLPGSPNHTIHRRSSHFTGNDHQNAFLRTCWTRPSSRRSSTGDRKQLVSLQSYIDAQKNLPYADDSAAVTPMSEDNLAFSTLSGPVCNSFQGCITSKSSISNFEHEQQTPFRSPMGAFYCNSSCHSSYTSHSSRMSYTSHGDIYGRLGFSLGNKRFNHWQPDHQLRARQQFNASVPLIKCTVYCFFLLHSSLTESLYNLYRMIGPSQVIMITFLIRTYLCRQILNF